MPVVVVVVAWLGATTSLAFAQGQPLLYSTPFQAGDGGRLIYRIPALWTAPGKPLLAFAEGRVTKRRAAGNIDVVLRRSVDGGQTWEPTRVVADLGDDFCGNPCVVRDESNGRLWLAFTRSRGVDVEEEIALGKAPGTKVFVTHSDDDGATWAAPVDISASARRESWGWYGTGPGQGLWLGNDKKGRLLIPAYHSEGGVYRAHGLLSDDQGATWRLGEDAADHSSEPQVVSLDDGLLLMSARTIAGHGERRTLRISRDGGVTWKPADGLTALPELDVQGCLFRVPRSRGEGKRDDGKPDDVAFDLVFTQPLQRKRADVHAWLSGDGGRSWPYARPLWNGPSAYTALALMPDGQVGALIECGSKDPYERIAFVRFAPEWLRARVAP